MKSSSVIRCIAILVIFSFPARAQDTLHFFAPGPAGLLEGELYHKTKEPSTTVLFLVGSGTGSTLTSYRDFVRYFFGDAVNQGINIAIFNKRGIGRSAGRWDTADFEDRAADAAAVAQYLIKDGWSSNVILAGHSQGGWIAQVGLSKYPELFSAGLSMAGPSFSVEEQLINDYCSQYICAGADSLQARSKAERKVKALLRASSFVFWKGRLRQLKTIRKFDPVAYWPGVTRPLLFMWAENDTLVNPSVCIGTFEQEANASFLAYRVIQGANHSFRRAAPCTSSRTTAYSAEAKSLVEDFLGLK